MSIILYIKLEFHRFLCRSQTAFQQKTSTDRLFNDGEVEVFTRFLSVARAIR